MENRIKKTFICKDVSHFEINETNNFTYLPVAGDVAIFEVISIGKHANMQNEEKRNAAIYPGDLIMAAFGTRYATEQFEGYLPEEPQAEYHILGAGGTVGIIASMHGKFKAIGPTKLKLVGYATHSNGTFINTKAIKQKSIKKYTGAMQAFTRVILSVGASMDSGKTTTAAYLVRGLKKAGMKVGFIKLTGTVYTKDKDLVYDNGADKVVDFGDLGFPSTYMCSEEELLNLYESLLSEVGSQKLDYVVVEIADGVYQRETEMLLRNSKLILGVDAVVFSAGDSLAAIQGIKALEDMHIKPTALCGLFTASPLLIKEVQAKTTIPILTVENMAEGKCLQYLEEPLLAFA